MPWSVQIGRAFGISIRLHLTFLLLIGWLAVRGMSQSDLTQTWLALGLFGCVLLHELGHSVVALRFGVRVMDITLLPIGGLARMSTIPRNPGQEFWIAIAGPAVNFVLAPLLYGANLLIGPREVPAEVWSLSGFLLVKLGILNLTIGVFNLLPAFPMDGGRILRAVLAQRLPYGRATQIAASLGQMLAFGMGFLGLFYNPLLVFVALFIFIGASEESTRASTHAIAEGASVREAMITNFATLNRGDTLGHAVEILMAGSQHDFPVVEGGEAVGILTRRRLLEALVEYGREPYISEVMEPAPPPVTPETLLQEVIERIISGESPVVPVQSGGVLCGLLTSDNIAEFVLVRIAMRRRVSA